MATQMYADAMPGRVPEGLTDGSLLGDHPLQGRIAAGLEPYLAGRALFTVYSYVVGFTIEEQAVYPFPGEARLSLRRDSDGLGLRQGCRGQVQRRADHGARRCLRLIGRQDHPIAPGQRLTEELRGVA